MEAQKQKGEGWVKGGEGLINPFTAISALYIVLYAILVKGVLKIAGKSVGIAKSKLFVIFPAFADTFSMKAGGG